MAIDTSQPLSKWRDNKTLYNREKAKESRIRKKWNKRHLEKLFPTERQTLANTWDAECCSFFGCGKTLTPTEKLFGNTCSIHNGEKKVDIMNVLKFK
jgi:hypothetical protein